VRVAERWFTRTTYDHGVTRLVEPHLHRIIRCNIWHVRGRDRDLVVDTGVGVASVVDELAMLLDRRSSVSPHTSTMTMSARSTSSSSGSCILLPPSG
jgi:hypothetical protein